MAISVRPISHHDQVSVFAHLGELRARLIVSVAVLAFAFAFAFWQNHAVLQVLNRPLADVGSPSLTDSSAPLSASTGTQQKLRAALDSQRVAFGLLAASAGPLTVTQRHALAVRRPRRCRLSRRRPGRTGGRSVRSPSESANRSHRP